LSRHFFVISENFSLKYAEFIKYTTSAPLDSDPAKKKVEYNYFINNQSICDCGYDKSTCDVNCPPSSNPPPAPSCSKYTLLQSPVYVNK
jgi:hypothetical protein